MEQSDFTVYEGIHEAFISEEDWDLAQEKSSKNNYKREKIHDPEHAHILSGILKCPCCGKGMYGNIAKVGRNDNKTRYYYYCKNTVNATGHKCTFQRNIEQSQIDDMLAIWRNFIMCRVIVIGNRKGGVGKTTTTSNSGIGLAKQGKRVLLIDGRIRRH